MAVVCDMAGKLCRSSGSQRVWCKYARRDAGEEVGPTRAEQVRIKEFEQEDREL